MRKRPSVIFGSDDLSGTEQSFFEILSNSIDEAREGFGKRITVTRYADHSIKIEDEDEVSRSTIIRARKDITGSWFIASSMPVVNIELTKALIMSTALVSTVLGPARHNMLPSSLMSSPFVMASNINYILRKV